MSETTSGNGEQAPPADTGADNLPELGKLKDSPYRKLKDSPYGKRPASVMQMSIVDPSVIKGLNTANALAAQVATAGSLINAAQLAMRSPLVTGLRDIQKSYAAGAAMSSIGKRTTAALGLNLAADFQKSIATNLAIKDLGKGWAMPDGYRSMVASLNATKQLAMRRQPPVGSILSQASRDLSKAYGYPVGQALKALQPNLAPQFQALTHTILAEYPAAARRVVRQATDSALEELDDNQWADAEDAVEAVMASPSFQRELRGVTEAVERRLVALLRDGATNPAIQISLTMWCIAVFLQMTTIANEQAQTLMLLVGALILANSKAFKKNDPKD